MYVYIIYAKSANGQISHEGDFQHFSPIVRALLELNPQRLRLLQLISECTSHVLKLDPVEPETLAVVVPVCDVDEFAALKVQTLADRETREALKGECDGWNRVLGRVFFKNMGVLFA
jgi:hypothetical protein